MLFGLGKHLLLIWQVNDNWFCVLESKIANDKNIACFLYFR